MKWIVHEPTTAGAICGIGESAFHAMRDAKPSMEFGQITEKDVEVCQCDDDVWRWVYWWGGDEVPYYVSDGVAHLTEMGKIDAKKLEPVPEKA